jgi:hypothetical protein
MLVSDLPLDEQDLVDVFTNQIRAHQGHVNKMMDIGRDIDDMAISSCEVILAKLSDGAIIPNASNLAGSIALTKEDIEAAILSNRGALAVYATPEQRQKRIEFAGINAN